MNNLNSITTCSECGTERKSCPYPAAYNSKTDGHQACEEEFKNKYVKREEN